MSVRWGFICRVVGGSVVGVAIALGGLIVVSTQVYANRFAHMGCMGERLSLAEAGYPSSSIDFETPRGYALRGWFAAGSSHPETVIVVLPGASGNTEFALRDAEIVAEAGYSTLIYEHRSCADPDLVHSGGYYEAQDLISAVDYLDTRPDVGHIGVMGFSVGGTASLLAAAEDTRIEAVIAMGGFSSLEVDVLEPGSRRAPLDWVIRRLVLYFLGQELGVSPALINPESRIDKISPRPLLLIYGEEEAANGESLYAAAVEPKVLAIVPGVGHGGYQDAFPDEYRNRIQEFFREAFLPVLLPAD